MNTDEIAELVDACAKCGLCKTRKNTVPGEGNKKAKIVFVGEAPGFWEDEKGKPFVGRAGKLLTETLGLVGIKRKDVFITNIVKCRPPDNRRPTNEEIEACTPYLNAQLEALSPGFIAPLGAVAGEYIFKKYGLPWSGMMKENGIVRKVVTLFGEISILPVIHPAAVLRNPNRKDMLISALRKLT